jgi:hypothetical protein
VYCCDLPVEHIGIDKNSNAIITLLIVGFVGFTSASRVFPLVPFRDNGPRSIPGWFGLD